MPCPSLNELYLNVHLPNSDLDGHLPNSDLDGQFLPKFQVGESLCKTLFESLILKIYGTSVIRGSGSHRSIPLHSSNTPKKKLSLRIYKPQFRYRPHNPKIIITNWKSRPTSQREQIIHQIIISFLSRCVQMDWLSTNFTTYNSTFLTITYQPLSDYSGEVLDINQISLESQNDQELIKHPFSFMLEMRNPTFPTRTLFDWKKKKKGTPINKFCRWFWLNPTYPATISHS